jgi:DeoR family transcriptional regulator of aga operon
MSSKTDLRAEKIMRALLRVGDISIEALVEQVGTSAPSIRRDLTKLEQRGLVRRTHGGATLVEPLLYEPFRHDTSFQARELRCADAKRRIGLAAAELICEKETVGLTAGTTTTQIGRALRHRRDISVITNALNIGMELCNQPAIHTTLTGGVLAWAWTFAMVGQSALDVLEDVNLDKAFIGVTGFDVERGATTLEVQEATVSRVMIRRAKHVILAADSSKLGQISPALICPTAGIGTLVTDTGLSDDVAGQLTAMGVHVIRV